MSAAQYHRETAQLVHTPLTAEALENIGATVARYLSAGMPQANVVTAIEGARMRIEIIQLREELARVRPQPTEPEEVVGKWSEDFDFCDDGTPSHTLTFDKEN